MRGTPYVMRRRILLSPARPAMHAAAVRHARRHLAAHRAKDLGGAAGDHARPRRLEDLPAASRSARARPTSAAPSSPPAGLVFIGAAMDDYLRAFDIETGRELWKGRCPRAGRRRR